MFGVLPRKPRTSVLNEFSNRNGRMRKSENALGFRPDLMRWFPASMLYEKILSYFIKKIAYVGLRPCCDCCVQKYQRQRSKRTLMYRILT